MKSHHLALVASLLLTALAATASAQTRIWDGDTNNFWATTTNWTTDIIPDGAGAVASFPTAANQTVDLNGGTFTIANWNISSATAYSLSNGTLNLAGAGANAGSTGEVAVSANLNLGAGQRIFTVSNGNLLLTGDISGVGGSLYIQPGGTGYAELSGDNTFTGGVLLNRENLRIGSDTALGSGLFTLGANAVNNFPRVSSTSTTARSLENSVALDRATVQFGDVTRNGKLTFAGTATLNTASTKITILSDVEFTGGLQAGLSDTTLVIKGNATDGTGRVTLGASSNRTAVTVIGDTDNTYGTVRAKASDALGSGDIQLGSGRGRLELEGGIAMDNNVSIVNSAEGGTFITSISGNNSISGSVKINANATSVISSIAVNQDTLTLSGGLTGFTTVSTNLFEKVGAGKLNLTGATDTGIIGLRIDDGALGVNGSSLTASQRVQFVGTGTEAPVLETSGTFSRNLGNSAGTVGWFDNTRNGGFAANGGTLDVQINGGTGTLAWASTGNFVGATGSLVLNSVTADNRVDFQNGINLNVGTRTINVLDNVGSSADLARISGVISGTGASVLNKTGTGVLELTGNNTYAGGTTVNGGTLLVNNLAGSGTGSALVNVASGAAIGGDGTISGDLTLAPGALFAFDEAYTLTLSGTLILDSSFGVESLRSISGGAMNWASVDNGTYSLLATSFVFNDTNISNFGIANAYDIGGGRSAYFDNGSLALVVVPEAGTTWLFLSGGLALWLLRRRQLRQSR